MNTGIRVAMAACLVSLAVAAAVAACTAGLSAARIPTPEQTSTRQEGPSATLEMQDGLRIDVTGHGLLVTVAISVDVAISLALAIKLVKGGQGKAAEQSGPEAAPDSGGAWTVTLAGALNRDVRESDQNAHRKRAEHTTAAAGFAAARKRGQSQEG